MHPDQSIPTFSHSEELQNEEAHHTRSLVFPNNVLGFQMIPVISIPIQSASSRLEKFLSVSLPYQGSASSLEMTVDREYVVLRILSMEYSL